MAVSRDLLLVEMLSDVKEVFYYRHNNRALFSRWVKQLSPEDSFAVQSLFKHIMQPMSHFREISSPEMVNGIQTTLFHLYPKVMARISQCQFDISSLLCLIHGERIVKSYIDTSIYLIEFLNIQFFQDGIISVEQAAYFDDLLNELSTHLGYCRKINDAAGDVYKLRKNHYDLIKACKDVNVGSVDELIVSVTEIKNLSFIKEYVAKLSQQKIKSILASLDALKKEIILLIDTQLNAEKLYRKEFYYRALINFISSAMVVGAKNDEVLITSNFITHGKRLGEALSDCDVLQDVMLKKLSLLKPYNQMFLEYLNDCQMTMPCHDEIKVASWSHYFQQAEEFRVKAKSIHKSRLFEMKSSNSDAAYALKCRIYLNLAIAKVQYIQGEDKDALEVLREGVEELNDESLSLAGRILLRCKPYSRASVKAARELLMLAYALNEVYVGRDNIFRLMTERCDWPFYSEECGDDLAPSLLDLVPKSLMVADDLNATDLFIIKKIYKININVMERLYHFGKCCVLMLEAKYYKLSSNDAEELLQRACRFFHQAVTYIKLKESGYAVSCDAHDGNDRLLSIKLMMDICGLLTKLPDGEHDEIVIRLRQPLLDEYGLAFQHSRMIVRR